MSRDLMHGSAVKALVPSRLQQPATGRTAEPHKNLRFLPVSALVCKVRSDRSLTPHPELVETAADERSVLRTCGVVGDRPRMARRLCRPATLGGPIEISLWRPRW